MTRVIELSDDEVAVALHLIELGGKAAGLSQFGNAAVIAQKISSAPVKPVAQVEDTPAIPADDAMPDASPARRARRGNGSNSVTAN